MMGHKHLHELLKEDQEPFQLKNYIFDKRSQLNKRPIIPKTKLQAKKKSLRLPAVEISNTTKRGFYKQACFFSFQHSPEVGKSPFSDLRWPATAKEKSPRKSPNAALLLEAAMRISQKQSASLKPKTQVRNAGFGLFGSILKRLSGKKRSRKREIGGKSAFEMGVARVCNNMSCNSGFRPESNEGKPLDLESSSKTEEIECPIEERENGGFGFCEKRFCSSPSSPFRFALQKSPSPSRRKPNFSSPATSPGRHDKQKENGGVEGIQKIQLEEEEEEKEQCSPVSVLDPPFQDDQGHENGDDDEDGYDLECGYAIVQRAKQQLLQKLSRFEKLAELDPIELEKLMLQDQEDEDVYDINSEEDVEECEVNDSLPFRYEKNIDRLVSEVLSKLGLHPSETSGDVKRMVLDLIGEERREGGIYECEVVVKSVCERLDSWKNVESNTIDMMVEFDFRREIDGWKRNDEGLVGEIAMEIEVSIFGLLVEELSEEIC